jgi:rhodanese-related sulfurtransferase
VLLEGLAVAAIGLTVAMLANALSPRGIRLERVYFPQPARSNLAVLAQTQTQTRAQAQTNSAEALLSAKIRSFGLQPAGSNLVSRLFNDPRRESDLVVFIDARDEEDYKQGHIPGAYEFYDPYRDKYLDTVAPLCQVAQQIVVYCHGGDQCDDSIQAALTLRDVLHAPKENLLVYGGGFNEWCSNGLPVEIGARNSGEMSRPPAAGRP